MEGKGTTFPAGADIRVFDNPQNSVEQIPGEFDNPQNSGR